MEIQARAKLLHRPPGHLSENTSSMHLVETAARHADHVKTRAMTQLISRPRGNRSEMANYMQTARKSERDNNPMQTTCKLEREGEFYTDHVEMQELPERRPKTNWGTSPKDVLNVHSSGWRDPFHPLELICMTFLQQLRQCLLQYGPSIREFI